MTKKGIKQILARWWPAIIVMALIFIFSSIPGKVTFPQQRRLVFNTETVIRKTGHLLEYAILACALLYAFNFKVGWREVITILVVSTLFAASDEFHQTFIPGRTGRIFDIGVDFSGAALGIVCGKVIGLLI